MFVQIIFSTDATVRTLHEVSYDTQEHDKTSPGLFIDHDVYIGSIESRVLSFRLDKHLLCFRTAVTISITLHYTYRLETYRKKWESLEKNYNASR